MRELISVIVTVYNMEDFLKDSLSSIVMQTYSNLEIVVIDDGSTDESLSIATEFSLKDSRIRVIHTENRGVSAARNLGLQEAQGTLIAFNDGDDLYAMNYLNTLYRIMEKYDADVVCAKSVTKIEGGRVVSKDPDNEIIFRGGEGLLHSYLKDDFPHTNVGMKLYRKSLLAGIVFQDLVHEDVHFTIDVFKCCNMLVYTNETVFTYVFHKNSTITKRFCEKDYSIMASTDLIKQSLSGYSKEIQESAKLVCFRMLLRMYNKLIRSYVRECNASERMKNALIDEQAGINKKYVRLGIKEKLNYWLCIRHPKVFLRLSNLIYKRIKGGLFYYEKLEV